MARRFLKAAAIVAGMLLLPAASRAASAASSSAASQQAASEPAEDSTAPGEGLLERQTLTNNWLGAGEKLAEKGLSVNLSLVTAGQHNVKGGLSTSHGAGCFTGRYDLEVEADLEKSANLPGGRIFALARGGWSDGIGAPALGAVFNPNATAIGDHSIDLWQLFYEQSLWDERVRFRIGKIDLTNCLECQECKSCFDGNAFANDECKQFLNSALTNNPTIPFPEPGLGTMIHVMPVDGWYLAAGASDAGASVGETGFKTAFHGQDDFFSIYETGILPKLPSSRGPLQGAYRVGMWYDPQAKAKLNGGGLKRDDHGFYASCDQMLLRESKDDNQGLGIFGRYGIADADVSEIKSFWSGGVQYQGLIPKRDDDVVGLGVAQGRFSRSASVTKSNETVIEFYYNIRVAPWLSVSPDVQYIFNPGGAKSVDNAVVIGVRFTVAF